MDGARSACEIASGGVRIASACDLALTPRAGYFDRRFMSAIVCAVSSLPTKKSCQSLN